MNDKNIDPVKISLLKNATIFFYDAVFIIEETNRYRLIISHRGERVCDTQFLTLRGARISFEKLSKKRKAVKIKPEWTPFYQPEAKWLEYKLNESPVDSGIREFLV
jgi:hypothetical protein